MKLKKIFRKAWKITVRDQKSWEQLKKIGIESEIVDDPVMHERPHPNPLLKGEGMNCNLQPHLLLEEKNCDEVLCGKEL